MLSDGTLMSAAHMQRYPVLTFAAGPTNSLRGAAWLTGAKEGAIGNVKAHILTENKVTLGTYPGVTFEAENDSMHFSASIYLVGTTLYQTLTAAPLKDRFAESAHFMNSFMLIPRIAQ